MFFPTEKLISAVTIEKKNRLWVVFEIQSVFSFCEWNTPYVQNWTGLCDLSLLKWKQNKNLL